MEKVHKPERIMYKLKHCREYFTKNKVRGARPSTLFS